MSLFLTLFLEAAGFLMFQQLIKLLSSLQNMPLTSFVCVCVCVCVCDKSPPGFVIQSCCTPF